MTKGIVIAGTKSNCGKTTLCCGLLHTLKDKLNVKPFKCGPDYIDPMYHKLSCGTLSHNLDIFLCGEDKVKYLYNKYSKDYDFSIIEGAMGFKDGVVNTDGYASAYHLSTLLGMPLVIIFTPDDDILTEGDFYILNKGSQEDYLKYKEIYKDKLLGYVEKTDIEIKSRHLGLITPDKNAINTIKEFTKHIKIDTEKLIKIGKSDFEYTNFEIPKIKPLKIGIAYDKAFCFHYSENYDLIREMGGEIEFFSPLKDKNLPHNIQALMFFGGYPEIYKKELSENTDLLNEIKGYGEKGLFIYGECGGFMYLHDKIDNIKSVGLLPSKTIMTDKLNHFGYIKMTAQRDNIMCKKGETINAHEFHYSISDNFGDTFICKKNSGKSWLSTINTPTLLSGYPHLYFYSNFDFIKNFLIKAGENNVKTL